MAVNDLYQLSVSYHTPGGVVSVGQAYLMDDGIVGDVTLLNACVKFQAVQADALKDCLALTCEIDQIRMDQVSVGNELPGILNINNLEGVRTGDALPNNAAACIKQITNAPNSKHNGRMYLAGLSEDDQVDGVLQAPIIALLDTFMTSLLQDLDTDPPNAATFTPVIISRYLNKVKRPTPVGFNCLSNVLDVNYRQQRRRTTERLGIS